MISVAVVDQQSYVRLPKRKIQQAVQAALHSAGLRQARMTVALIDDAHIQQLNRQFLQHDEPTDVLSFPMGRSDQGLEGEIVVSAQRAAAVAGQYGWTPEEELLLYIIHGALHLAGFDDATAAQRRQMRQQEAWCLQQLGLNPPAGHPTIPPTEPPTKSRSSTKLPNNQPTPNLSKGRIPPQPPKHRPGGSSGRWKSSGSSRQNPSR